MMKKLMMMAGLMLVGCDECQRVDALDAKAWEASEWISVKGALVAGDVLRLKMRPRSVAFVENRIAD